MHLVRRSFGMGWQLGRRIPFLWDFWDTLIFVFSLGIRVLDYGGFGLLLQHVASHVYWKMTDRSLTNSLATGA